MTGMAAGRPEAETETDEEKTKKFVCPDERVCEVSYEWTEPCEVFFCDDYCQWGSEGCLAHDEPPRPDCEVLTCSPTNSTPTPSPPDPPSPTPSPTPTPPGPDPTPSPSPQPDPSPPKWPVWKLPILVVGGIALAILLPVLAYFGIAECKHQYGVYKLREHRRIAENVRLEDRIASQRFSEQFNRAMEGYVPLDNSPHPDSIEVHMEQEEAADREREREREADAHRRAMEAEAAERYRRFHGHEDEPLIRINVRGGAVRMSRMWSDIKEKSTKMGQSASESARNLKAKIRRENAQ